MFFRPYSKKERKSSLNVAYFLKPKARTVFLYDTCSVRQGLEKMHRHSYTAIPVITREGAYVGTVSEGDFLWYLVDRQNGERTDIRDTETMYIRDLLRPDVYPAITINATMEELLTMATTQNFVPVTDDLGSFIGIVTRADILRYFAQKRPTAADRE